MAADDVVALQLGYDRGEAYLIAEACKAEGVRVELLDMDGAQEPAAALGIEHRLLVRRGDLDRVETILRRSGRIE